MHVDVHENVDAIEAEWDDLAVEVGARPWARPGWFTAWAAAFGNARLHVLALRRDGALTGVLPLVQGRRRVDAAANWHSPTFGILARDGQARFELAAALYAERPMRISFPLVDREEDGLDALGAAAAAAGYAAVERVQARSPFVPTLGSFDDYARLRGPNAKHRKDHARSRRRLVEQFGSLSLVQHDGRTDLDELLREGFRIESSGWKTERGTAIAIDARAERFYTLVARWAASQGLLKLCFLRAGDTPLAFDFMLDDGRSFYDLKRGYDAAYRAHSPGVLLLEDLIRLAFVERRETFELLGDADAYKLAWTDNVRERVQVRAYAPTLLGRLVRVGEQLGRPVARRLVGLRRA